MLLKIRANLLAGLDLVGEHAAAGTLHTIPEGKSSPIQAGQLTLVLLDAIDVELAHPHRKTRHDDARRNRTEEDES